MIHPTKILGYSAISGLGATAEITFDKILDGASCIDGTSSVFDPLPCPVGEIRFPLPRVSAGQNEFDTRCASIALACLDPLRNLIHELKRKYAIHRLGVVCGTSASGTLSLEKYLRAEPAVPFEYHSKFAFNSVVRLLQKTTGFLGPSFAVSTACSSASNAMISASNLIRAGICDAVLTGGIDALCETTYYGFQSLQIVDSLPTRPFDRDRAGLSLGEGAALFILAGTHVHVPGQMSPEIILAGHGCSSDAYHMTAPDPDGLGAELAMTRALENTGISAQDVDYINLHGTGTPLNDEAESRAVARVFSSNTRCSSTKGFTGHLLGAAAAIESAICIESLRRQICPGNSPIITPDPAITIPLLHTSIPADLRYVANNSFAFGGNDTCLIFGGVS